MVLLLLLICLLLLFSLCFSSLAEERKLSEDQVEKTQVEQQTEGMSSFRVLIKTLLALIFPPPFQNSSLSAG